MPRRIIPTLTLGALTMLGATACSMPGESSSSPATATPGSKTVTINNHTVTVPAGFTLTSDIVDGTTKTVIMINDKKMPTNINVATNPQGFDVSKWCTDMQAMLKKNFAPGAKITATISPSTGAKTECQIVGHGKTANIGQTSSAPASSSSSTTGATSTTSAKPAASSTSSSSANPSVIKPGTPFSITTNVKKASNGSYVALMSRQLDENYKFDTELKFFNEISK